MAEQMADPLFGDFAISQRLSHAPLVRVLAQVRFAEIMKINDQSYIANFQEAIRRKYPITQQDNVQSIQFDFNIGEQKINNISQVNWRFFDSSKVWRVSLGSNFISLETLAYVDRSDFLSRLSEILAALIETVGPTVATRIGFRYVNRIDDEQDLSNISGLIRESLLGVLSTDLESGILQTISEAVCETREGRLIVRWGKLPPNVTYDGDSLGAVPKNSWVLDIDSFAENFPEPLPFSLDQLNSTVTALCSRGYTFFRWCAKPKFIERFGAIDGSR